MAEGAGGTAALMLQVGSPVCPEGASSTLAPTNRVPRTKVDRPLGDYCSGVRFDWEAIPGIELGTPCPRDEEPTYRKLRYKTHFLNPVV